MLKTVHNINIRENENVTEIADNFRNPLSPTPEVTAKDLPVPRLTNKEGKPAFSDNWTVTSDMMLIEHLGDCDFMIGTDNTGGHHQLYVCNHCHAKVNALSKTQQHYTHEHQKSDAERIVIINSVDLMRMSCTEINDLKKSVIGGGNKLMAISQLETIVEKIETYVQLLKNLKEKNLPPTLLHKRTEMIRNFEEAVVKVRDYISRLETKL